MNRFLRAGALAGAAGGLVMAIVLRVLGEGPIGDAIALESAGTDGVAAHDELYSRAAQQVGGMLGAVVFGVFVGVIVAVVFASVRHRLPGRDDWTRSLVLAAVGFVSVVLVPFLKYPANPPAVGDPDTVGRRTVLFLILMAFSILSAVLVARLGAVLARRLPRHVAVPAAAGAWLALIAIAYVAFPANTDPVEIPATLVWRFRIFSLAGQLGLWGVVGLSLGALLDRRSALRTRG